VGLNTRFAEGRPSSNLGDAGILFHQWDHTENLAAPWKGCPRGRARGQNEAGNDCEMFGDRFSASLIYARMQGTAFPTGRIPLFSRSGGGVIYKPPATRISCSYAGDGGSRSKVGGCGKVFCDNSYAHDGWCDGRPHQPSDLETMMHAHQTRGGYNEVIVDTGFIEDMLPTSIEAIFCVACNGNAAQADQARDAQYVRQVRTDFMQTYGLAADTDFPLVRLDPSDWAHPFSVVA